MAAKVSSELKSVSGLKISSESGVFETQALGLEKQPDTWNIWLYMEQLLHCKSLLSLKLIPLIMFKLNRKNTEMSL